MYKNSMKRIKLLVEGHAEDNYFQSLNNNKDIKIKITPTNMKGGGYSNFINKLRKESTLGFLAIFVVIDLDKAIEDKVNLDKLIKYCSDKNKVSGTPFFIIGTYKDFELFSCCHCREYSFGDTGNFIKSNLKFKSVTELKGKKDIYNFLNSNNRSYKIALDKLKSKNRYITNDFKKSKKGIDIIIKANKIKLNYEALSNKHSNVEDLFRLIGLYE